MAKRGWLVDRRRLGRMLNHSDPVLRWQFRCLAVSWVMGLAAVFGFIVTFGALRLFGAAFLLFAVVDLALEWTKHTRRARRMMGSARGGPGAASLWAIRNGDYAIRFSYVSILAGFLMIVLGTTATALAQPPGGDDDQDFDPMIAGLILLIAAQLLRLGHMGVARQRNAKDDYGASEFPILSGTFDIMLVFIGFAGLSLGLAFLFLTPLGAVHLLLAQKIVGPFIMIAGILSLWPRQSKRQRDLQDRQARLVARCTGTYPAPRAAAR